MILPGVKLVIFVDGCFWHGCPAHYQEPDDGRDYWRRKLCLNTERDRRVDAQLRLLGWQVHRVWEHDLLKGRLDMTVHVIEGLISTLKTPLPN